jgi:hypothetical protein
MLVYDLALVIPGVSRSNRKLSPFHLTGYQHGGVLNFENIFRTIGSDHSSGSCEDSKEQ